MAAEQIKFSEQRSEVLTFRLTPTQKRHLEQLAAELGVGEADFIRQALDHFIAHHLPASRRAKSSGRKRSSDSASSAAPSSDKAKVSASKKGSPAKSTRRKQ